MFLSILSFRKIVIILFSVLLLSILICTYLLKVVPDKENELNSRGFRILGRIESNFFDKKLGYLNMVDYCFSKNKDLKLIEGLTRTKYWTDEQWKKNGSPQVSLNYDKREDKWDILFYSDIYNKKAVTDSTGKNISVDNKQLFYNSYVDAVPVYQCNFKSFIKPLVDYRKDFFEDYIVFYKDSILFQSAKFAFQNTTKQDTLFNNQCIKSGMVLDVTLSGKEYKAFYQPFNISSNTNITICGLISKENYNRNKFMLNNYQMMLVLVCFLLLILIFPFLKMFTITRYERMMKTDIGIMLLCLLGISAILTVLFFPKIMFAQHDTLNQKYIKKLNNTIQANLKNEIDNNINELNRLEKFISVSHPDSAFYSWYSNNYFNRYATHEYSLKIKDGVSNINLKADSSFYRLFKNSKSEDLKDHIYVENILFINSTGVIKASWEVEDIAMPKVVVENRQYFKEIVSPHPTKWKPSDTKNKYSLEPIYSYTNQQNTIVFTKAPSKEVKENFRKIIGDKLKQQKIKETYVIRDSVPKEKYLPSTIQITEKKYKDFTQTIIDTIKHSKNIFDTDSHSYHPSLELYENRDIFSVLGIETRLFSVSSPILSNEYGFCIIDKEGEVLFHSDKERNIRENFLEECVDTEQLKSAIYNNTSTSLDLTFYGKKHHAYISLLDKEYPLHVITFMDSTYYTNSMADMSNFGLIYLFSLIAMLLLLGILCYLFIIRTKYLAKQSFDLRFLTFSSYNYSLTKRLTGFMLINLLFFIIVGCFLDGFGLLFFIPLAILNIPIFGAYIMYHSTKKIIYKYPFKGNIFKRYCIVLQITAIVGVLILLLLGIAICEKMIDPINLVIILLFIPVYILVFYHTYNRRNLRGRGKLFASYVSKISDNIYLKLQKPFSFYKKNTTNKSTIYGMNIQKQITLYPFTLILFLCTTSIIPGSLLFKQLSHIESTLTQNRRRIEVQDHSNERNNYFSKIQNNSPFLNKPGIQSKLYNEGAYPMPNTLSEYDIQENKAFYDLYINVINLARSNYNEYEIKKIFGYLTNDIKTKNEVSSTQTNHKYFAGFNAGNEDNYLWLLSCLIVIYFVVRFLYKKITLIEYFFNSKDGFSDQHLIEYFEKSSSNLLILTLPGSGIEELYLNKDALKKKQFELNNDLSSDHKDLEEIFYEHDYELYSNKNTEPNFDYLLILKYTEFRADKSESLADRILSFEKYFKSKKYKVIWLSHSDPAEQVEKLIKNSNKFYSKVIKDGNYKDIEDYYSKSHTFDKMLKILDEFDKTYFSLTQYSNNKPVNQLEIELKKKYKYIYSVIDIELKYSLYLNKLRKSLFESDNGKYAFSFFNLNKDETTLFVQTPNLNEEIILKIQDTAYTYYLSLWNCLSSQEKFVLYDMAVDNLTNYHNLSILLSLKEKGLLVYADEHVIHTREGHAENKTLQIINKSFRNFILTRINPSEARLLEEELKGTTTWQTLRMIVGILIVLASIFIFTTQETVFQKYISLFTGIAAFLPLVLKVLTGFKDSSSGPER